MQQEWEEFVEEFQAAREWLGESPQIFVCHKCREEVYSAPEPPEEAFCETCCPDHEYEYDQWRRGKFCKTCDKQQDDDWDSSGLFIGE